MREVILCTVLFIFFSEHTSAQWAQVSGENLISHVVMLDDSLSIAAQFDALFRSDNGGISWETIDSFPGSAFFEDLVFGPGNIGIALNGGEFPSFITYNEGLSWDPVFPLGTSGWAQKLNFNELGDGIMLTSAGVYYSNDNFQTYNFNFLPSVDPLRCGCVIDSLNAIAVNSNHEIYTTEDGGDSWAYDIFISGNNSDRCDLQIFSSGNGVFIGENIVATIEFGESVWTKVIDLSDGLVISDAAIVSDSIWFIAGRFSSGSAGFVSRTLDAGTTWSFGSFQDGVPPTINAISCLSKSNCLATSGIATYSLQEWISTGIDHDTFSEKPLFIYPNPAKFEINIECADCEGALLELMSVSGKMLYRSLLSEHNLIQPQAPSGIYFLVISYPDGSKYIDKLVIAE